MQIFQHYEVKTRADGKPWELGRGAMGVSYLARDTLLDREVALKVVNAESLQSETARLRFQREARAAARLNHENVALVYQFGEEDGQFFYAMEFVRGETVEQRLRDGGPLDPALAVEITIQVCRALSAAEKEGLVHRDIKPANLMLTEVDGALRVKVIDFGLAKTTGAENPADATLTVAGFVGTPYYASPEQLQEQPLDIRSDIYSLGVSLWFMLVGDPPFTGTFANLLVQHLHGRPPLERLDALPSSLRDAIDKALKKEPEERFQTPGEFRSALEVCLPELENTPALPPAKHSDANALTEAAQTAAATLAETQAAPSAQPPQPPPLPSVPVQAEPPSPASRNIAPLLIVAVTGIVLVLLFLGGAYLFLQRDAPPPADATELSTPIVDATPTPPVAPDPEEPIEITEAAELPVEEELPIQLVEEQEPETVPEEDIVEAEPIPDPEPDPEVLARAAWEHAQHEEQQGRMPSAIAAYLEMLEEFPEDSRPRVRLGEIFTGLEEQRQQAGQDAALDGAFVPLAREAASREIESAMLLLGFSNLSRDPGEAARWFAAAAEKENPTAMNQLGLLYSNGRGVGGVDASRSMELFEKSADLGNAAGKLYLADAQLIEEGPFAEFFDPDRAVELFRESAALGEPRAMSKLGFLYDRGIGVPQSDLAAFQWYEKAWQNGLASAAANLGAFYMMGRGVPRADKVRGAELFAEGAAKRDPTAMTFYARCLFEGVGVEKNETLAKEFLQEAISMGSAEARQEAEKRGLSIEVP